MAHGRKSRTHWEGMGSQSAIDAAAIRDHGEDAKYDRISNPPSKPAAAIQLDKAQVQETDQTRS